MKVVNILNTCASICVRMLSYSSPVIGPNWLVAAAPTDDHRAMPNRRCSGYECMSFFLTSRGLTAFCWWVTSEERHTECMTAFIHMEVTIVRRKFNAPTAPHRRTRDRSSCRMHARRLTMHNAGARCIAVYVCVCVCGLVCVCRRWVSGVELLDCGHPIPVRRDDGANKTKGNNTRKTTNEREREEKQHTDKERNLTTTRTRA